MNLASSTPPEPFGTSPPRIVDVVFARTPREAWIGTAALLMTCTLHALGWLWARSAQPSLESWSADLAARVHAQLRREEAIELPKPKPPEPPPPPAPPKPSAPRAAPARRSPVAAAPPPPAQAGRIVARDPEPSSVDLTADTFVTGSANAYAGGTTTAAGTNTKAVLARTVAPDSSEPDRSRAVTLAENEWQCAWPRAADASDIDEQSVVLRVFVRSDGSVESARLLSDPGHGFGEAALACAARTHFTPARDRQGRALRAESPPIRVRFTR